MTEDRRKVQDLLLKLFNDLIDLKIYDLADLVMVVGVTYTAGKTRELVELVKPFYLEEIPWYAIEEEEE